VITGKTVIGVFSDTHGLLRKRVVKELKDSALIVHAGIAAVISGHTHQPAIAEHKGVLYINPGSAGPRRSGKSLSLARLVIQNGRLMPEIIMLEE